VSGYIPAGVESVTTQTPGRFLDTRAGSPTIDGLFGGTGRNGAGSSIEVQIAGRAGVPAGATAVLGNLGIILPDGPGFATLYPCGVLPTTSNMNHLTGGIVRANNSITKLSASGTICIFTLSGADLIFDVTGYLE
jgi:hypothetical protein